MPRPSSIQASGCSNPLADIRETQAAVRFNGQEQPVTSMEVQPLADLGWQKQTAAVPDLDLQCLIVGHN